MEERIPSDAGTQATLTIDNRQVTVPTGSTILEAAAELGIRIPTLCWLGKVSTTGACRICIVEIEGVDLPMTACNTPVKDGIKVTTSSPGIEKLRRETMELLLVNHPLDCPVCDAGGECELQNVCYELQVNSNRFAAKPENLPIHYDWPLIENCTTRCILCEKCVKVCHEIVGADAIEVDSSGDRSVIATADGTPLDCDFCGNCIDACPTGTLISKPFKFRGRPWSYDVKPGVCAFCSSGCQIQYHTRENRIERVTSSDAFFNRGNLCVNGRFGYAAFNSPSRITSPAIKEADGNQRKASWDTAIEAAASGFRKIISAYGSDSVAGIGSPRITNEESYLFQRFMRGAIGTNNIDSEARLGYLPSQMIQWEMLGCSGGSRPMDSIEKATAIIVVGADLKAESAGFAYRAIRAALKNDATLVIASSRPTSMDKFSNLLLNYKPGSEAWIAAGLCKAFLAQKSEKSEALESSNGSDEFEKSIDSIPFERITAETGLTESDFHEAARLGAAGRRTAVIYGAEVIRSHDMKNAVRGVVNLAILSGAAGGDGAGIYPLDEKNNTLGMLDMGVLPEYLPGYRSYTSSAGDFSSAWNCDLPPAPGKNIFQMLDSIEKGEIRGLYVIGSDPVNILPDRNRVINAFKKLELLVVQDIFPTGTAKLANIFLPAATAAEKSGSFTTADNRVQSFANALRPQGESRTDAEIIKRLHAMTAQVSPIIGQSDEELRSEISRLSRIYSEVPNNNGSCKEMVKNVPKAGDSMLTLLPLNPATALKITDAYPYILETGTILRHNGTYSTWSECNMTVSPEPYLEISEPDAMKNGIKNGDPVKISSTRETITVKARVAARMPQGVLFAPANFGIAGLNSLTDTATYFTPVKMEKA